MWRNATEEAVSAVYFISGSNVIDSSCVEQVKEPVMSLSLYEFLWGFVI
jgi:hypothetical protein